MLKRSYRRIFSAAFRARAWNLRAALRKAVSKPQEVTRHVGFTLRGRCEICGGRNLGRFTPSATVMFPFRFYRCRDCEYIFIWPAPETSENAYYDEATMPDFGQGEGVWNGHYLTAINQYAATRGRLLEIGFGNASFLKLAQTQGWEVYGVDLSRPQVEYARENLNLRNVQVGTIESLAYLDGFFDVICGFNFLEHVPRPRKTLEKILRLLKPSGVFAVMCPNISGIFHLLIPEILGANDPLKISWCPPDHLSYFNKRNLSTLLESVGLTEVTDRSEGMSSLWRQFEPQIGPDVTGSRLNKLASEIRSSTTPQGDARVAEFRGQIKKTLVERMTWTMVSDLMELEPLLGAEVGVYLLGRKASESQLVR